MDAETLRSIVNEIRENSSSYKEGYFEDKYPVFVEKYPMLFKMCCDPTRDIEKVYYMIDMIDQIEKNKMTEHIASVNVGQKLFDEYVKPVVGNDGAK